MTFAQSLDRLVEAALAPGAAAHVEARLRSLASSLGRPVLDVGCGFSCRLAGAGIAAIGLDLDERRIRALNSPALVGDAAHLPFADASFAAAFSFGVLHHLADKEARRTIADMRRVVRQEGAIILFDAVLPQPAWRHPLAATIRALDRGRHMRNEAQLRRLFEGLAGWRFERVTYAATGLEGLWCLWRAAG